MRGRKKGYARTGAEGREPLLSLDEKGPVRVFRTGPRGIIFSALDLLQPVQGLVEGVVILGEVEADQVVHRLPEKAGAGHRGRRRSHGSSTHRTPDRSSPGSGPGPESQRCPAGRNRSPGGRCASAQPVQTCQEHIPLPGVQRGQLLVIGLREADSHAGSLLKGGGGPTVRKSWTFLACSMTSAGPMR